MINEAPRPTTDAEKLALLLDAAKTAYSFLEVYCDCKSRNLPAKQLRVAIQACESCSAS